MGGDAPGPPFLAREPLRALGLHDRDLDHRLIEVAGVLAARELDDLVSERRGHRVAVAQELTLRRGEGQRTRGILAMRAIVAACELHGPVSPGCDSERTPRSTRRARPH